MTEKTAPPEEGSLRVYVHFRSHPAIARRKGMEKAGLVFHSQWSSYALLGASYHAGDGPGYLIMDVPRDKLHRLECKQYVVRVETPYQYKERVQEEQRLAATPFCPNCGRTADEDAAFCPRCGKRLCNAHTCADCGAEVDQCASFCWACGARLLKGSRATSGPATAERLQTIRVGTALAVNPASHVVEARHADSMIPDIAKRWSWGAFALGWVWGVFNKVWISLLMILLVMIPVLGWIGCLIFAIVLGDSGKEWAWKNGSWRSVEHFTQTQDMWDGAGIVYLLLLLTAVCLALYYTL